MIPVELTWYEFACAVSTGLARFIASMASGLNAATTYKRTFLERLNEEVTGACGEMAYSKYANEYWSSSINTFHGEPDVGRHEVRATRRIDGSLILRDNDDPNRYYVLVVGEAPTMYLAGYILGASGRREEYLRNPHHHRVAWFVPQSDLAKFAVIPFSATSSSS